MQHSPTGTFEQIVLPFFYKEGPSGRGFSFNGPRTAGTNAGTITPNERYASVPLHARSLAAEGPKSSVPNMPTSRVGTAISPPFVLLAALSAILYSLGL